MPEDYLILEGIVTTLNADGGTNISPMGPLVDWRPVDSGPVNSGPVDGGPVASEIEQLIFRPYQTSRTFSNLKRTGQGVLHVTDDVELLARAAVGDVDPLPALMPARQVEGRVLCGACRWYEFRVTSLEESQPRTRIEAQVVQRGWLRDFFGFNRAKHAVVEAAILATRTAFLPAEEVQTEFARLAVLVEKTGGLAERRAFQFLQTHVAAVYRDKTKPPSGPGGPEGGKTG